MRRAFVDHGYTGEKSAEVAAAQEGIRLEVFKHTEGEHGFVLLPQRWVIQRSFALSVEISTTGSRLRTLLPVIFTLCRLPAGDTADGQSVLRRLCH